MANAASGSSDSRATDDVYAGIDRVGHMPLPPYIKRNDQPADRDRYQTVFARERGSVAAPTAGLHFTGEILDQATLAGAHIARVTLHVGLGTFQPIEREDFENHQLHFERYSISDDAWREINAARRVVAVGTTSVRAVESAAITGDTRGSTNLFIHPGYDFRRVGAMLTNFHLPRTSLLLLVCAFAGTELTLRGVPACGQGAVSLLFLRRLHAHPVIRFGRSRHDTLVCAPPEEYV